MKIKINEYMSMLVFIAKILSFLSLVMSIVIKTRVLLGISNKLNKMENKK